MRIDQIDRAFLFRNERLSRRSPLRALLPSFRKWRTDKRVGLSPRPTDYVLLWCLGPEILPCPVTPANQDPRAGAVTVRTIQPVVATGDM